MLSAASRPDSVTAMIESSARPVKTLWCRRRRLSMYQPRPELRRSASDDRADERKSDTDAQRATIHGTSHGSRTCGHIGAELHRPEEINQIAVIVFNPRAR